MKPDPTMPNLTFRRKLIDRLREKLPLTFRGQAMLFLVPTIVIMSLVYTIESVSTERKILRNEIIKKGETIVAITARNAELPVLSENLEHLKNSALPVMEIKDVAFVSFLNKNFQPLLHEGKQYLPAPPLSADSDMEIRFFEQGDIFEFVAPVVTVRGQEGLFLFEGVDASPPVREHIGWVRIGLSKEVMARSEREILLRGGILAFIFTIAGIVLVYLFISLVTRPLHALIAALKEVREGEHPQVKVISPKSEIGRLTNEFNRMSRAIREREEFLNNIIENIPHMIFVKDVKELRFLRFNKAGEDLLGYTREELHGKNSYDLFPKELADIFVAKDKEVLHTRRQQDIPEEIVQSATRGERILHSKKIPILDENGDPSFLLGISEDITERKQAEDELERHRNRLEELVGERTGELTIAKNQAETANRVKSDFLSSMSHELRTPLNAILGYAQILKRQENLTEPQRQQLEIMHSSGEHLLTLINDILDVGKIEAGKMDVEDLAFDLPALLRQVFNLTKLQAEEKELRFVFEATVILPRYVHGDERKLRQILLNLLSNAVKYTRRGCVTLRVGYSQERAGMFHCEVMDTGIGIPADKLEAVFEPFNQLAISGQPRVGTGLGLNITRHLVDLMDGSLTLESELGKGSTFRLQAPLPLIAENEVALKQSATYITGYQGERKRILVVDDTIGNTSMLVSLLEPLGFELETAQNGVEALHSAATHPPDLVLMDLVMPEMDGLEAVRRMRNNPELAAVRIIGASATVTASINKDAFVAECDDFVEKPVMVDLLLEKIGNQLALIWERSASRPAIKESIESEKRSELLVVPPSHELEVLYDLAKMGDMLKIEKWADDLECRDTTYICFAEALRELAGGFRTKAILAMVEQHRGEGA